MAERLRSKAGGWARQAPQTSGPVPGNAQTGHWGDERRGRLSKQGGQKSFSATAPHRMQFFSARSSITFNRLFKNIPEKIDNSVIIGDDQLYLLWCEARSGAYRCRPRLGQPVRFIHLFHLLDTI